MKKAKFFKVTFLSLMTIFCFSFATVEHRPTLRVEVFFEAPLLANQEFETDIYYANTNRLYVLWRDDSEESWTTRPIYEIPIPDSTKNIAEESRVCLINSVEVGNVLREFLYVAENEDCSDYDFKRATLYVEDNNI